MIKREFKINLKSLIIWTSILVLMLILVFCIYPYIINEDTLNSLDDMMEMFPPELLKAFNMDLYSISTSFGWIKTEGYMFITLIGSIYSGLLGSSILSKEEKDKTIEFLISKPIKRKDIVTSKILCGIVNIFIFNLLIFLTNLIGVSLTDDIIIKELLLISICPLLLYYMLFFSSLLISTYIKNAKKTTFIGLIIAFIAYILQLLGSISDKVSILKDISLFEFVSIRYITDNLHINYIYLCIGIVLIIFSILFTYKIYDNKELV